jgi:hypothetical protein
MQDIIISLLKLNLFPVKRLNWVFGGCFFLYPLHPSSKWVAFNPACLVAIFALFPLLTFFPVLLLVAVEIVLQSGKGLFLLV